MRLNRRGFMKAGAAGAAGAALLPTAACDVPGSDGRGRMNVLLLIIDSLRPDHVGAYGSPPRADARDRLPGRPRPPLQPRVPRGDGHAPGAALDLHEPDGSSPSADFVPNPELGSSPGWEPIKDPETPPSPPCSSRPATGPAQVSDNPFLAFTKPYEPFRKSFERWDTVVGQSGFINPPSRCRWRP